MTTKRNNQSNHYWSKNIKSATPKGMRECIMENVDAERERKREKRSDLEENEKERKDHQVSLYTVTQHYIEIFQKKKKKCNFRGKWDFNNLSRFA